MLTVESYNPVQYNYAKFKGYREVDPITRINALTGKEREDALNQLIREYKPMLDQPDLVNNGKLFDSLVFKVKKLIKQIFPGKEIQDEDIKKEIKEKAQQTRRKIDLIA